MPHTYIRAVWPWGSPTVTRSRVALSYTRGRRPTVANDGTEGALHDFTGSNLPTEQGAGRLVHQGR